MRMLVDDVTAADPSLTQLTQPTDSGNASALSSTLQVMAKSVPRDGVWDQRHLVVRSTAPVPGRVLEVRPVVRGQFVCSFVVSMNLRQSADKQYERMAIADPLIYPHEALVGRGAETN